VGALPKKCPKKTVFLSQRNPTKKIKNNDCNVMKKYHNNVYQINVADNQGERNGKEVD
jgi:hypothetical protein